MTYELYYCTCDEVVHDELVHGRPGRALQSGGRPGRGGHDPRHLQQRGSKENRGWRSRLNRSSWAFGVNLRWLQGQSNGQIISYLEDTVCAFA